ncbi:MAG: amidohydrolase [bacterium]|nr:amidohydrolase [Deltaproteobacteria bacterium]MCP4904231.1 amidohydrolase [bacterium]
MSRFFVVSSDCHAGLPPEQYGEYLDPEFREPFKLAFAAEVAERETASRLFMVDEFNKVWKEENWDQLQGAWDHDRRMKMLDGDGIAVEIIFPDGVTEHNTPPFDAGLGLGTEGVIPEQQWAGARAHNRWLVELCQMAPERRIGLAVIPLLWDIDEAIAEVRWARKKGLGGVLIPSMWGGFPAYHSKRYDPFWQACVEEKMVVHFHAGPAPRQDYFMPEADGSVPVGAVGIYASEAGWWIARPITFMVWGGVFERYPDLRAVVTEGACMWVGEWAHLMDHRWGAHQVNAKMGDFTSHLKRAPSEYFYRNCGVGASVLDRREVDERHSLGLDCIMWGSDYPHPEGSWPRTPSEMTDKLRGLPEKEIAAILGGNAARIYDIDPSEFTSVVDRIGPELSDFVER